MGKMIDILAELTADNSHARQVDLAIFADALKMYRAASENVQKNGAVCLHPRTNAPIENPYLKVMEKTGAVISRMNKIDCNRVMELLNEDDKTCS